MFIKILLACLLCSVSLRAAEVDPTKRLVRAEEDDSAPINDVPELSVPVESAKKEYTLEIDIDDKEEEDDEEEEETEEQTEDGIEQQEDNVDDEEEEEEEEQQQQQEEEEEVAAAAAAAEEQAEEELEFDEEEEEEGEEEEYDEYDDDEYDDEYADDDYFDFDWVELDDDFLGIDMFREKMEELRQGVQNGDFGAEVAALFDNILNSEYDSQDADADSDHTLDSEEYDKYYKMGYEAGRKAAFHANRLHILESNE